MGTIRFFRHSLKKGQLISKEGFELIEAKEDLIPHANKVFVSPYVRTIQTATHMLGIKRQKTVGFFQLDSLSPQNVEEAIMANAKLMEEYSSNPEQNLYFLMEKHFSPEELIKLEKECAKAVIEMSQKMENEENAIAVGHTPYIKMAYNGLIEMGIISGEKCHENMTEMDYIDIII